MKSTKQLTGSHLRTYRTEDSKSFYRGKEKPDPNTFFEPQAAA